MSGQQGNGTDVVGNTVKSPFAGYPQEVQDAIGYIAMNLAEADQYAKRARRESAEFRRAEIQRESDMAWSRAHGASAVLGMFQKPPEGSRNWPDAIDKEPDYVAPRSTRSIAF